MVTDDDYDRDCAIERGEAQDMAADDRRELEADRDEWKRLAAQREEERDVEVSKYLELRLDLTASIERLESERDEARKTVRECRSELAGEQHAHMETREHYRAAKAALRELRERVEAASAISAVLR